MEESVKDIIFWALVIYLNKVPLYFTGDIKFNKPVFTVVVHDALRFPDKAEAEFGLVMLGREGDYNIKVEEHMIMS
jgi:hypothetical protein